MDIPVIGHYAVHGFFILSGYLMTFVMTKSYGYTIFGGVAFFKNRILRLYPSYWILFLFSIVIITVFGEEASASYRKFIYFPDTYSSLIQNLTMVYLDFFPGRVTPRVSPPTWALSVELFFYFLIAIGISKNKRITIFWVSISVFYMIGTHLLNLGYSSRYSILFAGSFPFSLGALLFHYKVRVSQLIRNASLIGTLRVSLFCFILNCCLAIVIEYNRFSSSLFYFSFYLNYLLNFIIIAVLASLSRNQRINKLDTIVGNYSYPIYIFHWQAGFLASMILWSKPVVGISLQGIGSFILGLIICVFAGYFVIRFIDAPIEKLRTKIKERNAVYN